MMDYLKRRFSSGECQNELTNLSEIARQSVPESKLMPYIDVSNSQIERESISKKKSKLLFIIDNQYIDW
jgi:hypothetical protein